MTKSESAADWIKEGEKYALIGISLDSGLNDRSLILDAGLSVLPREAFQLPEFWREALGSIGVESVERCNLFLVAKTQSN